MRRDMSKVIVERPRRNGKTGSHHPYRAAKKVNLIEDEEGVLHAADEFTTGSNKAPMCAKSLGWNRKELNENLSPLWHYLDSQVGRLWDDVYSEVCEHINPNSTVQQHILQHLFQHVDTDTFLCVDGHVYDSRDRIVDRSSYRWSNLYVHPITGILCRAKRETREEAHKRRQARQPKLGFLDGEIAFVKMNDVWYRADAIHLSERRIDELFEKQQVLSKYSRQHDAFGLYTDRAGWGVLPDRFSFGIGLRSRADELYGHAVWLTNKRAASKADIKKYELNKAERSPLDVQLAVRKGHKP